MYFYVDESGHTGPNLFDETQPMLYYGVLSSKHDVDAIAEAELDKLRQLLGVERLHANELGNGELIKITKELGQLQSQLDFCFDVYRVAKPDHAIISFFDQVFDCGVNPAMTWSAFWTPLRYALLFKLAFLFNEEIAEIAWNARISVDDQAAQTGLIQVCNELIKRLDNLPDLRSRQLIDGVLTWAINNPGKISYNVSNKKTILQISPNIIGFQSVMFGIADRIKSSKLKVSRIIVDQQSQFNKAQRTLAEFYAETKDLEMFTGPGLPELDTKHIPEIPIEFASSKNSAGLELVDIHLWIFKRFLENKDLAPQLFELIKPLVNSGITNEISLKALRHRWTPFFRDAFSQKNMTAEQTNQAKQLLKFEENRRLKAINQNKS